MTIVTTKNAEEVANRCRVGALSCSEANELHAECCDIIGALVRERDMLRAGDTCARQCEGTAYRIEARQQKRRADALAATIRDIHDVVTHSAETKAEFIARVRAILSTDQSARVAPNVGLARPKKEDVMKKIDRRRYTKERSVAGVQEIYDSSTNQWLLLALVLNDSDGCLSHDTSPGGGGCDFGGGGSGGDFGGGGGSGGDFGGGGGSSGGLD